MPPKKSNVLTASNGDADSALAQQRDGMGVEDLNLPRTMVQRLAKGVLPPNTQIQKDALLAMSKSATVFVNYLTAHANDVSVSNSKKTIAPKDVLEAIREIELEGFLPRLEGELERFNSIQCDKRNSYRRKVKEDKAKAAEKLAKDVMAPAGNTASPGVNGHKEDEPPAAKKARRSGGEGDDEDDNDEAMSAQDDQEQEEEEDQEDEESEEEEVEEGGESQLQEDPLEDKEQEDDEDEVLNDDSE